MELRVFVWIFGKARPVAAGLVLAYATAACGDAYEVTGPQGGPLVGGNDAANSVQDGRALFHIYDYGHSPGQVTIPAGTAVEWRNVSALSHSISNYSTHPQAATWDDALVAPGEKFVHVFDQPGEYGFVCIFHQEVGYVTVVAASMGDDMMGDGMGMDDMMDDDMMNDDMMNDDMMNDDMMDDMSGLMP